MWDRTVCNQQLKKKSENVNFSSFGRTFLLNMKFSADSIFVCLPVFFQWFKYIILLPCDLQHFCWEICSLSYWGSLVHEELLLHFFQDSLCLLLSAMIIMSLVVCLLGFILELELFIFVYLFISLNLGSIWPLLLSVSFPPLLLHFFWNFHKMYIGLLGGIRKFLDSVYFSLLFFPFTFQAW